MRQKQDSGKYILENNLRTWSELKRERLAAAAATAKDKTSPAPLTIPTASSEKEREKEKKIASSLVDAAQTIPGSPIPVRKKWGGCPNGCDHGKHHYHKKTENSMHAMGTSNGKAASPITQHLESLPMRRPPSRRWQSSSEEDEDDPRGRVGPPAPVDVKSSLDAIVTSSAVIPSTLPVDDRIRPRATIPLKNDLLLVKSAGRDFGGSASGNTSQAGSDPEFSPAEEKIKKNRPSRKKGVASFSGTAASRLKGGREESGMGRGAMADALGDQSDVDSGRGSEAELDVDSIEVAEVDVDIMDEREKEERSVRGQVY